MSDLPFRKLIAMIYGQNTVKPVSETGAETLLNYTILKVVYTKYIHYRIESKVIES